MYRIKCSNGKYVSKTREGSFLTFTKKGKVFMSETIANRNLQQCLGFAERVKLSDKSINSLDTFRGLTFELELIG